MMCKKYVYFTLQLIAGVVWTTGSFGAAELKLGKTAEKELSFDNPILIREQNYLAWLMCRLNYTSCSEFLDFLCYTVLFRCAQTKYFEYTY